MATTQGATRQPVMTYPDVYYYLAGINPNLANALDYGCRFGKTIDEALANMTTVQFADPQAQATWRSGIAMARSKIAEFGAGACTWSDPTRSSMASLGSTSTALGTAAQTSMALVGSFNPNGQSQGGSNPAGQPGGPSRPWPQQPPPPQQPAPWDGGRCEVLQGGARCGPIEGGHCGEKCGGGCDSCLKPTPGGPVCMWDAPAPSPASLAQACAQPLRWNCETIDADLSICEIDRIRRTQRTWSRTVTPGSGLVIVPADAAHIIPAGFTLYAFELPAQRLSHWLCLRQVSLTGIPAGGGAPVAIIPDMVYIEVEKIWNTGDGNTVHAWTYPKPEEEEYIKITDGRCACSRLCDCVPARSRARILALVPTPAAGTIVTMSGKGKRECWGAMCGPCPPDLICDRSVIVDPPPVAVPNTAAGWLDFIDAQQENTGVSVDEVFAQVLLAPGDWGLTPAEFAADLVAAPVAFKDAVLGSLVLSSGLLGWSALDYGNAFAAEGGTLSYDVFAAIAALNEVTGGEFATALSGAPAGVRTAALIPLMANYSTYGWTGGSVAQALDLAGGTLDVDVNTAFAVNNYITGAQYATAIQFFNAGNKASILTVAIGNYVANGWTAVAIANACVAAGGTLAADVKAALP